MINSDDTWGFAQNSGSDSREKKLNSGGLFQTSSSSFGAPVNLGGSEDKQKVLVIEDEEEIRDLIVLHVRRQGLDADAVSSAEEAKRILASKRYSLIVLDWMLPGESGVEIARRLRRDQTRDDLAILMVTARGEPTDIVEGLDAGADDYLVKPFDPEVLNARVRALMRRGRTGAGMKISSADGSRSSDSSQRSEPDFEGEFKVIRVGRLALYPETHECKCAGEDIALTPSEFKLLLTLAHSRGRVLTRDSLIQHVQGEGVSVVGRTVDTHVFGLRKKLGPCADVIETVRGVGYRVKPQGEMS